MALVEWDNMMGASFRGLHTLVTVYTEAATTEDAVNTEAAASEAEARVRRSNDVPYSHRVPYTQTSLSLSLASTSWGAEIALQTAVEDTRGQEVVVLVLVILRMFIAGDQSERLKLFSEGVSLQPPSGVRTSTTVAEDDSLEVSLAWEPHNVFEDNSSLPLLLRLYEAAATEAGDLALVAEQELDGAAAEVAVALPGGRQPWQLLYSLETKPLGDLGSLGSAGAAAVRRLVPGEELQLRPPDFISISSCEDTCHLEWCTTARGGYFQVGAG